jgi:tetratricopeptide (TPR) repeat protein
MKPRSRKPSRAKRARPSARRSAGKYRWALLAVVSVLILAAAIWGWKRATHREDRPSTPLPSPVQTPKLHIESFLASLQDRSFQDVTDIKAEEKTLVETVVSDFPGRTGPLSLLAAVYHSHGDIEQAEQLWQKALAIAPAQPQIYLRLGLMAEESDQLDKAIAYWQQGLKLNPQAPNLRWHLANAMILQGRLEGTVELLQTECTLTPASARNYFLLGQVHLKQDAYEQAETCYEKALELQPEYFNAYYGLGKVYTRLRQPDKARECMQTFMKMKTQREGSEDLRIVLDEVPVARTRAAGLYRQASSL